MTKTKKITLCAIMVALSTVLALISKIIPAPWLQGGSVTVASMAPVILISVIIDCRWGLLASLVYSLIQMMTGFYPPPTQTVWYFFLVVLLDYILAFGVCGLGGFFYSLYGKNRWAMALSGATVALLRYVCHILSGVLIWGVYANEGQSVLAYSLIYNGTYMVPETIITAIALFFLYPAVKKLKN